MHTGSQYILRLCAKESRGRGNSRRHNDRRRPANQTQAPKEEKKEPVELTAMLESHDSWPFKEDWYALKLAEEETNVKLKVTTVMGSNYEEKLNITIASGNLPDIIHVNGKPVENQTSWEHRGRFSI